MPEISLDLEDGSTVANGKAGNFEAIEGQDGVKILIKDIEEILQDDS